MNSDRLPIMLIVYLPALALSVACVSGVSSNGHDVHSTPTDDAFKSSVIWVRPDSGV